MEGQGGIQRSFVPGDRWLYYKLYMGHKTSEFFLTEVIKPFVLDLQIRGIVEKWFFIRFTDPDYHLRIRFFVNNKDKIGELIQQFRTVCSPYSNDDQIWKIQIDTYHRELERYGFNNIELSETLFSIESNFTIEILSILQGEEYDTVRWKLALRLIDQLLTGFDFSLRRKNDLLQVLKESFSKEFGMDKYLKRQLDLKFREERQNIVDVLEKDEFSEEIIGICNQKIKLKNLDMNTVCAEIVKRDRQNSLNVGLDKLVSSYIHMLCNRYFRTNQRKHELAIYYLLSRYYQSKIAILKKLIKTT